MEGILSTEILIIVLLVIISLVSVAVRRIRLPYTVALVLVGLALTLVKAPTFLPGGGDIDLTQDLILLIFIPPLVFEAAFHLNFADVKRNLIPILLLAIPGVLIVTFLTAGFLIMGAGVAVSTALIFGAIIAATDPVAVVAIFKELGVPKKLATIVEGESLFNDGTAIVVFHIILGAVLTGHFDLVESMGEFVKVSVGGLIIGLVLGWICARLIALIDDALVETTLTTILAYGSFIVAEEFFHFSGVLAVVAAGILNGNVGPKGMSATTKIVLFNFWEYLAFLANSLIFLLIGLDIELPVLLDHAGLIILAWIGLTAARAISVYSLSFGGGFLRGGQIPLQWQHILSWGGLKGAISLALALGLSAQLGPERASIQAMTFGVVLITLLIQGPTIKPLINKLKVITHTPADLAYEKHLGESLALKAAKNSLKQLYDEGLIPAQVWETLNPEISQQEQAILETLQALIEQEPSVQDDVIRTTRHEILLIQRGTLHTLYRDGLINEAVFHELVTKVDVQLEEIELTH